MCIVVAKPAGVTMPDMTTFENCFIQNPDGAGMMIAHNGIVYGDKGFMTFAEFQNALESYEMKYGNLKSHSIVFHFRIGTHGTVSPQNTHPFPLMNDTEYASYKALHWTAQQGFAHNGIIYKTTHDPDIFKYDVSDSVVFGKAVLAPLANLTDIPLDTEVQNIIRIAGDSKFCIMDGLGNICTIGTFTSEQGVMYSNGTFKRTPSFYKKSVVTDDYSERWAFPSRVITGFKTAQIDKRQTSNERILAIKETDAENLGVRVVKKSTEMIIFTDEEGSTMR